MKSLIFCVTVFVFCSGFLLAMSSRVLSRWNIWWRCPGRHIILARKSASR